MLARFFPLIILIAAGAWCQLEAQESDQSTANPVSSTDFRNGLEQKTFLLINQYRKANQFPPLEWNSTIADVARIHSRDMATGEVDFGHGGFGDRVDKLKTSLVGLVGAGENVLKTDDPNAVASRAVDVWLHSPHHLKNIRGDYNCSGMGIWVDPKGMIYFTQIFVKLQAPTQETQAAPPPGIVTPFGFLATPKTR